MMWGFILCSIMTYINALNLAEISSAYPQNGSIYTWSKQITQKEDKNIVSFFTGTIYIFG